LQGVDSTDRPCEFLRPGIFKTDHDWLLQSKIIDQIQDIRRYLHLLSITQSLVPNAVQPADGVDQ
jgi:hypothetical protein